MIQTRRFFAWLWLNLDALALGSLVALGLVGLMLIARFVGQRIVGKDPRCLSWKGVIGRAAECTRCAWKAPAARLPWRIWEARS